MRLSSSRLILCVTVILCSIGKLTIGHGYGRRRVLKENRVPDPPQDRKEQFGLERNGSEKVYFRMKPEIGWYGLRQEGDDDDILPETRTTMPTAKSMKTDNIIGVTKVTTTSIPSSSKTAKISRAPSTTPKLTTSTETPRARKPKTSITTTTKTKPTTSKTSIMPPTKPKPTTSPSSATIPILFKSTTLNPFPKHTEGISVTSSATSKGMFSSSTVGTDQTDYDGGNGVFIRIKPLGFVGIRTTSSINVATESTTKESNTFTADEKGDGDNDDDDSEEGTVLRTTPPTNGMFWVTLKAYTFTVQHETAKSVQYGTTIPAQGRIRPSDCKKEDEDNKSKLSIEGENDNKSGKGKLEGRKIPLLGNYASKMKSSKLVAGSIEDT